MGLIVQKFGGSSVRDRERLLRAMRIVRRTWEQGDDVVVVLSAQGDTTDALLARARELTEEPPPRELDALLATGETASVALGAIALASLGVPAVSLSGWQVPVGTDGTHGGANVRSVGAERIRQELAQRRVVLAAGFQGVDMAGDVTTLGRGGSDTSAVALAAFLGAERCIIYTDVDGVYTTDPRVCPTARRLAAVSCDQMLRLAACLEEHYPHSIANAVVAEARDRGLTHEEYHSQVQYVVAHGISSRVDEKTVLIGSAHFVFEDEGCRVPEGEEDKFESLPPEYSHLYLCIAGELAAVICIHDPLRKEAKAAVRALHELGIDKVVMMTGDSRKTAEAVAAEVGVDAVYAEVLPEDKAAFVRSEKAAGRKVIMIGDGVNDSPALSEADAGIAISTGAAIAREIADITISSEDLFALVTLRSLSQELMARIHRNYRFIVSFNFSLIVLGVLGILPPTTSALLHNMSTLAIGLKSMTNLLPESEQSSAN